MSKAAKGLPIKKRFETIRQEIQRIDKSLETQTEDLNRLNQKIQEVSQRARDTQNQIAVFEKELSEKKEQNQAEEIAERQHFEEQQKEKQQQLAEIERDTLNYKTRALEGTSDLARIEADVRRKLRDLQDERAREEERCATAKGELDALEREEDQLMRMLAGGGRARDESGKIDDQIELLKKLKQRLTQELAKQPS
jgi:chromosome segregation ATPase